jgi:hypothetical protein
MSSGYRQRSFGKTVRKILPKMRDYQEWHCEGRTIKPGRGGFIGDAAAQRAKKTKICGYAGEPFMTRLHLTTPCQL